MICGRHSWMALALAVAVVAPVWAQEADEAPEAAATPPAVAATLEDVTILRALAPLKLTARQLAPLVERLEAGAARVKELEAADALAWVTAARTIRQAIPQAASGAPSLAADTELARIQLATRGKVEVVRRQTRDDVRALLEKSLTPAQLAALVASGKTQIARERLSRLEEGDMRRVDWFGRELDRLREASQREYPQARRRFAMQMANLPGWWEIGQDNRMGNRAGRGGAPGEGAVPAPGVAHDGRARTQDGLQREQERLRRQEQRTQTRELLADPARRAQYQQFLTTADQIRAMAPALYEKQRAQLSLQLLQTMTRTRAQTASNEEALNAFIERYLLSPRAPIVLKERLEAMGA